ncbi:MAG TPA: PP2C family protein-serine/threonine phosphatase [Bacteroidota bacterium]|nr:PP2C family protein-serine/threonine phosphatase [Bacteroidota bacterium]
MIDPVRFKKILVSLLKVLILVELVSALGSGFSGSGWGRFGLDLIVAGVLYLMWERLAAVVETKKEEFRRKMESTPQAIGLLDALAFSLLWTDRIYENVPKDRLRLIVISYTLITLGLVAAFLKIGSGLMPLVVSGALVLGAVNLVTWVISLEREEKESLQTELKLAHDVQVSLMPKADPSIAGFDIAGASIPAANVGGDLFDYARLGGGADGEVFGISVFDVSGKGMQAAMSAVFTCGAIASEAAQTSSPAEMLTRLNRSIFVHSRRGHFVAFLLGAIDGERRTLTFANAGQTKPLLRTSAGLRWLEPPGVRFPLGMKEDSVYEQCTLSLQRGDIVFMLTDGFTEAMNLQEEVFGSERIENIVRNGDISSLSSREIIDRLVASVRSYAGEAPQHDDMTIVVVKAL